MTYAILKYILFIVCFGLSFYAVSSIQFDKFCSVKQPRKVVVLLFISPCTGLLGKSGHFRFDDL